MGWRLKSGDGPLPETLTAEQMAKLEGGGEKPAKPLPGEGKRSSLLKPEPKSLTASDDDLGIASPMAENTQRLIRGGEGSELGRKRAHTTTELEGDPLLQGMVAGAEGAVVAAPVAGLVGLASPVAGKLARGAVSGGAATAAQGGDLGDVLKGAAIGTVLEGPAAAREALKGAAGRNAARLQTDITGGSRSKAAKQVLASQESIKEVYAAHPDLEKTMATGSTAGKLNAVRAKLDELTDLNDAATEAIAKHHGKISTDLPTERLANLAVRAEEAGDEVTRDAVTKVLESIDSFAKGSSAITAQQLRGIRNGLAAKVQQAAPGSAALNEQVRATMAIKAELNDTIADLAGKTPGVDVKALRLRNKQIATLMPVETQLFARAEADGLAKPHDFSAEVIEPHGARKMIAGKIRETRARADYALANSPTASRLFGAPGPDAVAALPKTSGRAAASGTAAKGDDLSFAAKVAQAMQAGLSLKDAVAQANAN